MAVVSALYLYPFVRSFSDAPDAGVYLCGADLVSRGAIPSRDFVEPQGPGSFVWLALFFKLFGTTLQTARLVLDATGVGLALLAFWLSRRMGATGLFAALFVLLISVPLMPINSPHYDSNLFALGALALFLPAWEKAVRGQDPDVWRLVSSAALCGVTGWTMQQKGAILAVALLLSLLSLLRRRGLKAGLIFSTVFAVVTLIPFALFAGVHALPDVLFANYIWPMTTYSDVNASPYGYGVWTAMAAASRQPGNSASRLLLEIAFYMPFLMVAALPLLLPLAAGLTGKKWLSKPLLPYWLAAYALWFSELHRMDMGHLRHGVVIMAVLFFTLCEAGGSAIVRRAGTVVAICVAISGAFHFLMSWDTHKRTARRGDLYVGGDAPLLDFLDSHTRAGEEVFVYPYQSIYYFVENLRNPTRYSYLLYRFHTDSQFQEATRDLERKKVRYVIFDKQLSGEKFAVMFPAYRQPDKSRLIMEPYLDAHYQVVREAGRYEVLARRP